MTLAGRVRRGIAAYAAVALLSLTGAQAQTLADLEAQHLATLQAFQDGDISATRNSAQTALSMARAMTDVPVLQLAWSLNNLAYVLFLQNNNMTRAETLWHEALTHLSDHDQLASDVGVNVAVNLARLEQATDRAADARQRVETAMQAARGTPVHATMAAAAAVFFLDVGAFQDGVVALNEMATFDSTLFAGTFGDLYVRLSDLSDSAEQDRRAADVATLIEAKLIIARAYLPPDDAAKASRDLIFQRYYALNETGEYDRARSELLTWFKTATPTDTEQQFIQDMVGQISQLAETGSITTTQNLQDARTAVAFARGLNDPTDYRLGLVLRKIATAESHLNMLDREAQSLSDAALILERTDAGRRHLHHVFAQMAWNAALQGDYDTAAALFDRSDVARQVALALGPEFESYLDLAAETGNRAHFLFDIGDYGAALDQIATARGHLGQAPLAPDDVWPWTLQTNRLLGLDTLIGLETDRPGIQTDPLLISADAMRAVAPPNNAEYALALTNIADTLAWTGSLDAASALLTEAIAINDVALPDITPQSLEARAKLAQINLGTGRTDDTIDAYRHLTQARKSTAYRWQLPDNTWDFEILAWSLIDNPQTRTPARLAEAFDALQWTQITRSAEALSLLETRLSVQDPGRGALLRQRQDLIDAQDDYGTRLAASYAAKTPDTEVTNTLKTELLTIETDLAQVDSTLGALGLDIIGVGQVNPMPLADVQAALGPGEMLLTFLLPSLNPDYVAGLDASSNHVIGVTADTVHVARLGEISRRVLNERITAFRCDVAISDPGCTGGGAQGLRGAMLQNPQADVPARDHFDFDTAYALYADLFGGLDPVLSAYDHLIIAPPPDMLRLPFQALITTPPTNATLADADWLVRRHAISVLPSIASLRTLRPPHTTPSANRALTHMLGFGDPEIGSAAEIACGAFDVAALRAAPATGWHMSSQPGADGVVLADVAFLSNLPRLPDSVCELQAISTGFADQNVTLHTGAAATETRLKELDAMGELEQFDVLIFATHGLTAGEAGAVSPGLVLTPPPIATSYDDGLLTAAEIATLNLNADLVVLSACNTAAGDTGDQDGLSGLARAFFQSGAKSLLVTHWSVYSEAAVDVTTGMFSQLNANGTQSYGAALQQATLAILDDPSRPALHKHPSYWAAFSIIGAT